MAGSHDGSPRPLTSRLAGVWRCLFGRHLLSDYVPITHAIKRTSHGVTIVRAVRGRCLNCGRETVLHTEAVPHWNRHGLRWRVQSVVRRFM